MIKKKNLDVKVIEKVMKKVIKSFKLTSAEKREFERMIFEEKMSRKHPPKFRTCPGGCPGLHKH